MLRQTVYLWKQAPFLRLIIPLIAGILIQWQCSPGERIAWIILIVSFAGLIAFNLHLSFVQYKAGWINGVCINALFCSLGMLVTWHRDMAHQQQWLNKYYKDSNYIIAVLQEPLSEKENSYKANAAVAGIIQGDSIVPAKGNIIVYFKKDTSTGHLAYGSTILFNKALQPIKNSGNPGAFDYKRYAAFQGIYQQVYLQPAEYKLLRPDNNNPLQQFLFATREKVLNIINTYIKGKKEAGLAAALLIGYKDDLDKTLVQSYSNTGVVHVIAISGMHLGLIYWLLTLALAPLKKRKMTRWAMPLLIITGLWLFALLTGGGPSILRSAVMFTCIVIGESLQRKTILYNSLAVSAFVLLCINPFWLWDAGFQLSYAAVLSIVIFSKPIYHWFYFTNKFVDTVWKLSAVTLAAQLLTTPVSMFHFHQFPVYFLITNLLAVPLSSLIVLLEIALCGLAWLPVAATLNGALIQWCIYFMNSFIEHMENLPLSLWNGMQVNIAQVVLLYGAIAAFAGWLMLRNRTALFTGLVWLIVFFCFRTYSFIMAGQQVQLVVYNIPKHQAIDFISARNYFFLGDPDLLTPNQLQNFHLKPSRTMHRVKPSDSLTGLTQTEPFFIFNNKTIVLLDKARKFNKLSEKINADLIIISKNAPVQMEQLLQTFNCRQIIFDASNSFYKVNKWRAEAAKLGLHCFSVVDNGAFVMNIN